MTDTLNLSPFTLMALLAIAGTTAAADAGLACNARSGQGTAALLELYTSEGCSSCPPADRWLSKREADAATGRLVPLAFHVDYWDYLGWRDPYASGRFSQRQRQVVSASGGRVVYTPQVMLDGRDVRAWRDASSFDASLRRINRRDAAADVSLALARVPGGRWQVDVRVATGKAGAGYQAYLAVYENGLRSAVSAGENEGRELRHDYVVREWVGSLAIPADGRLHYRQVLATPLPAAASAGSDPAGVAVFVQHPATGEVLQALRLPLCGPG